MEKDFNKFMELIELSHETTGTDWVYNRRVLRLHLRELIKKSVLNGEIRENCGEFCPNCRKRIRMQGNGILEPLCECSILQNSQE